MCGEFLLFLSFQDFWGLQVDYFKYSMQEKQMDLKLFFLIDLILACSILIH